NERSRSLPKIKELIENLSNKQTVRWLDLDKNNISVKVSALPTREDVDFPFQEHLIVELYSK
ncbi:MAG: 30S ribosomal protein S4, partial [Oscillospiraceae bacterium]|nr:30S ribosomal protein S4 [Oscillospiraceae bacterium]